MKASLNILRGELERLFSVAEIDELCSVYLSLDPKEAGVSDDAKAVYVRRLVEWSETEQASEALVDSVLALKKGLVDPRLKQLLAAPYPRVVTKGEPIPGFTLKDKLGADDVSVQYLCHSKDDADDGEYVFRAINGEHAANGSAAQRYLVCSRILKNVESDVFVELVQTGMLSDGRPYRVYRKPEGESLVDNEAQTPREALQIFEEVLGALEILNESGLVHADIRPDNVYVSRSDEDSALTVALSGAGFDKFLNAGAWILGKTLAKSVAPEVARGDDAGLSSDIYALGCLLFVMIAGKQVYVGRRAMDIAANHLNAAIPVLSESVDIAIPPALDVLVSKLLVKEVSSRPATIGEVRKLYDDAMRGVEEFEAKAAQTGTREDIAFWADQILETPADDEILNELVSESKANNAWGAAIEVLEEAVLASEDEEVTYKLLMVAAGSATRFTKDYEKAEQIYAQLQEIKPDDQAIAAGHLELLRAQGRFEDVLQILGAQAEEVEEPEEKQGLLLEMGQIFEKDLKEPAKAFDYYVACLSGAESDRSVIGSLEKIAKRVDRFADLAEAAGNMASAVENAGNTELAVFYYHKLGGWYLGRLDQTSYALGCYQKVLELVPTDEDAMDAIVDMYRGAQQWGELAQILVQRAETETSPSRKRELLSEAAKIFYERMSDIDTAKNLLDNILTEDPSDESSADLLIEIYEKSEQFEPLAKLLTRRVDVISDNDEQVKARFKLGEIYEVRLNDPKSAMEQFKKAVDIDGTHLEALKGLERVYALEGDFAGLREVLEAQLEVDATPKQQLVLLERLAEIYDEEFKDIDKAIEAYVRVIEIEGENRNALTALTRHYRKTERNEELVEVLYKRAMLCEDVDEKRELLNERAEIIRDDIKDSSRAAEALNELAELGGGDGALDLVVKSQIDLGDFDAATKTFERMLEEVGLEGKVPILIRLAELQLEKIENIDAAAETLNRARELAPSNTSVMSALAKVLVEKGDYAGALTLMEEEVNSTEGSKARAAIYAKMGQVALENVKDEEKAQSLFEHALSLDENNLLASDNVSTLYRQAGEWEKVFPIYEKWIPSVEALDLEKQIELLSHAAECYVHMDRQEKALELFKKAAEIASEPSLMKRLGDVALEMGEWQLAKEQFAKYAELLGSNISPEEKVDLFIKRGRAYYGAESFDDAAKMIRQATVMDAENTEARLLLADIHEQRGDFRGAVEARKRVIDELDAGDERLLDIKRKTAAVMFEKLRNADGAALLLNEALEQDPRNRDVLGELLKMHYATKKFKDVVKVVLRIAELVEDATQLSRYFLTVAKIYRRELRQPEEAINYFEKALAVDPDLEDARNALTKLLNEQQDWEGLEKVYKRNIATLDKEATAEQKLEVYKPLADLYITKLDKQSDAITLLEAISKIDVSNLEWVEKLVDLYGWKTEHTEKAVAAHMKLLGANVTRVESIRMLYRIHSANEDPDKAWCTASVLSLLNQAAPDERQFHNDYLSEEYPPISNRIGEDEWTRMLYHEEIAHSMGSIVAVDTLLSDGRNLDTLITIGSPLGIQVVQEHLKVDADAKQKLASDVGQWFNLYDRLDIVALDSDLQDDFSPVPILDIRIRNEFVTKDDERNHHKSYGYLRSPELGEIARGLL